MDEGDEEYSGLSCMQNKCRQVPVLSHVEPSLFDLRVFYVRLSCSSSPHHLTLRLTPQNADTSSLEINGERVIFAKNNSVSLCLGKNRANKECEEATFVSTDNVRTTGNLEFQVCDKENVLICGSLEFLEGFKRCWCMDCYSTVGPANCGYLRMKKNFVMAEVYVAGSFSGCPVILTKNVHLIVGRKATLDAIPEATTEEVMDSNLQNDQVPVSSHVKPSLFALRAFYVRLSCLSSSHYLTLRVTPQNADTSSLEINGKRVIFAKNNSVSLCLGKKRVNKECEEATFVSMDNVQTTGNLQFQVCDKENVLICVSLEFLEVFKRCWCMDCYSTVGPANCGYLRGKKNFVMAEVYVAGSFSGCPVNLKKNVHLLM
ncbi:hypothetical protein KI387_011623 [Taxus chinensis]|uniref:Uncharacterized protein n=1 Tax=Taxus chinensis TaxID=29808 RepID=A0AA38FFF6_TAXCH|nr:hypothetical protein KI387_011623 [Taxus chinensis]